MPARRTPRSGARGGPRNSRPAAKAGAASGRARAGEQARPRPRLTNRAAILLVVFAVLVVSYASSMRAYLRQQAHIADLKERIAVAKADIADAERETRRWKDPAFVRAQTRERFGWVLPGETAYQVLDRNGQPLGHDAELSDPGSVAPGTPVPWWAKVSGSIRAADDPTPNTPAPATEIVPDAVAE